MLNRLLAAGALCALALASAASAQDEAAAPVAATESVAAAAEAPAAPRVYAPVDFNIANDPENILLLDLSNGQRVAIRLMPSWAPNHVERIKTLTREGFYNGVKFHRVIEGFMAQTGDPTGTGRGGSSLPDLKAEFNPMPHLRGTISMAHAASDDSANSQFFITFYPRFSLDRKYTNFGRVIAGMDAVDAINRGEPPAEPTVVLQASIAADGKPQAVAPPAPAIESPVSVDELNAPLTQ
ncbi:peptidylprolyl isomerase [Parafrankia sp. BMG5.11]|uniref:peptidylprolyl isomerase n=1 Tax=Parafrankia sp. BMG5.11 TaxID=222540 RepID=UPI001040CB49|nr:peptidylprolyl isomerase [Parafrankia sp. BMG5.11]TCJ39282.1 peptidylprolyl isomerase [Parafrankia sp. BMG5.11]